ncbi:O-antigen ligase family protein [Phycisphaerales bacterium AB-hyl4]|uniref:O-antigen ligase family protein n=1 Tax=Natronomicrosphaera hydrolytica TaxID=3242702 RepID=A0ABV4U3T5_9BACT
MNVFKATRSMPLRANAAGALTNDSVLLSMLRSHRLADRYLMLLALVLLGYALFGRGFAYVGLPPLFLGELVLALGFGLLLCHREVWVVLRQPAILAVIAFVVWGMMCTLPYLGQYGIDALRDAVLWGYALYALVVATLLIADPARLAWLMFMYRRFIVLLLVLAPIVWLVHSRYQAVLPTWPWAPGMPVLWFKGGDHAVHLAGAYAYLALFGIGGTVMPLLIYPLMAVNMGIILVGRAATLTVAAAFGLMMLFRPRSPLNWGVVLMAITVVTLLWTTGLVIDIPNSHRKISIEQLTSNIESMVDESEGDLHGTKRWRLDWWATIVDYTFYGDYFWTGKGFGVNLADVDGFQADPDSAIRSPHNGHLTVLARMGVPGLAIWLAVHGLWALGILDALYRSARARMAARIQTRAEGLPLPPRLDRWFGLFAFLFVYYIAFLVNASFDVFLEGPMGGVWFWTVYGIGLAAVWIYHRCPETLDVLESHENSVRP